MVIVEHVPKCDKMRISKYCQNADLVGIEAVIDGAPNVKVKFLNHESIYSVTCVNADTNEEVYSWHVKQFIFTFKLKNPYIKMDNTVVTFDPPKEINKSFAKSVEDGKYLCKILCKRDMVYRYAILRLYNNDMGDCDGMFLFDMAKDYVILEMQGLK